VRLMAMVRNARSATLLSIAQPLGEQAQALPVPPQYLEQIAAPAAKDEQRAAVGSSCSTVCTRAASPSKPFLMSVTPHAR